MNKIISIVVCLILTACNHKQEINETKTLSDTIAKTYENKYVLKTDTFSFKGIQIDDKLENLKSIYSLQREILPEKEFEDISFINSRIFSTKDFQSYSLLHPNKLTMFENKIDNLKIHTYKNIIYAIDISILENDETSFNLENIITNLYEKYSVSGFVKSTKTDNNLLMPVFEIANSRLSIKAFMFNTNKKNKYAVKGASNECLKMLRIEVTNLHNDSIRVKQQDEELIKKQLKEKNDF